METNKTEELIREAIHDVCEECIARKDCQKPCYDVVRMRQLAIDVKNAERERCIKAAQDWYCSVMCVGRENKKSCATTEFCLSYKYIRKAIEKEQETGGAV